MENIKEIKVLDHGFVRLVDSMGDDSSIVQSARVSYGRGTKKSLEDRNLIRYLINHKHTTPLEMVTLKFHMSMPIFVQRQIVRHRTASINEASGRYSEMSENYYTPAFENIQGQSLDNKQGRSTANFVEKQNISEIIQISNDDSYKTYKNLLNKKLTRELARTVLPVSYYTEFYWQMNLHNLFHFLKLRMDSHAQWETQQYANAIYELIKPIVPIACEAFEDYNLGSITFSKVEIEILEGLIHVAMNSIEEWSEIEKWSKEAGLSNREIKEFINKLGGVST